MPTDSIKKERQSNNWLIWLLCIAACILLILSVYQHIQIKNSQNSLMEPGTIAKADTGQGESVTVNREADYQKTIQQLQAQIADLQAFGDQDPGAGRAGAIPPPDGSIEGGPNGDRGIIDRVYTPLIERLELSSEESKNFQDFLTERRQAWIEIEDEIYLSQPENEKEALKKELEDLAWEYDEQALELLGYKNYQKYNEYNSCLGIFDNNPVDEFKTRLGKEEEINDFQEERLITSMAEEFEKFIASTAPEVKGPPGFRVGINDEKVTRKIVAGLDNLQRSYITSARLVLTDSQMKKFEHVIKSKIDERKTFFKYINSRDFID